MTSRMPPGSVLLYLSFLFAFCILVCGAISISQTVSWWSITAKTNGSQTLKVTVGLYDYEYCTATAGCETYNFNTRWSAVPASASGRLSFFFYDMFNFAAATFVFICVHFVLLLVSIVLFCARNTEFGFFFLYFNFFAALLVLGMTAATSFKFAAEFVPDVLCRSLQGALGAFCTTASASSSNQQFYGDLSSGSSSFTFGPASGWNAMLAAFVFALLALPINVFACCKLRHAVGAKDHQRSIYAVAK
eukprot:ANDGO_04074.mRNA.1 hypothetical protein